MTDNPGSAAAAAPGSGAIAALLEESRLFPPDPAFTAQANVRDDSLYRRAAADPEAFWAEIAAELHWFRRWDTVLEWNPPFAKWFQGGRLNAAYNCLDRYLGTPTQNKVALHWVGEPGDERTLTYRQLWREVCRFANVLKGLGVRRGDRVTLYLPMVPELAIACLACARIGAAHSVVFGGFSADSLAERIRDSESKVVVTADGGYRRGNVVPLKQATDDAVAHCPTVEKVVVLERVGHALAPAHMHAGRDFWWHDLMENAAADCPAEEMDAEDLLFILYTSGSTGKPKGIAHTTGGYLTGVYATTKWVFDLKPQDIFWCTADIGWVTGHSYVIYGPMSNGATQVMYEGAPDYPDRDRFWEIVARYGVTIFYTAPTAIRAFMKWGTEYPERHDLSSLRLLGSVGEPINPEAWMWYRRHIGGERCPIVDTWWQTETGHILISPLPGVVPTRPGSATRPLPGIEADIVDAQGNSVPVGGGYLVLRRPWPGMLRTLYRDPERFREVYWSRYPGIYFTGDGAKRDEDGNFWVLGRVDDVMNVAGHRLSTMEIESALVDHPAVAEAAVIGRADEIRGQAPVAFVIVKAGVEANRDLRDKLIEHVARKIGSIARPAEVFFTAELPKTRSGKIMRRLLRDVAEGRALGDTTTLADPAVVAALREQYEDTES